MSFNRRAGHQLYFYLVTVLLFCFITKTCQGGQIRLSREAILYSSAPNNLNNNNNNKSNEDFEDDDFVPYQAERSNVFDWNLFKVLNGKESGNILISPLSVKMALILLYEGAQSQTAYELANAMQLPVSPSSTRDKFSTIIKSLQTTRPEYKLNIGTRLYIDQSIWVRQRYEAIVKTFYGVDVINTNLSDVHSTADGINSWVRNVTLGNIDKMIDDEGSLKDTVMVVLNALFFKGSWRPHTFSRNDTRIGKFHTKNGHTVEVPYMNSVGKFFICESDSSQLDAKILRLPYQGHKYAMYIILPRAKDGLDRVVQEINQFTLARHIWLMQESPVDVSIPKFKFDSTNHLKPALQELGIESIFEDTAILTGIARTRRSSQRLVVSDVLQKTGIEVNEEGTTAYAATEVLIANKIEDETFHARHPFLFYIEDESTGTILYIGKVTNPLEKSGTWKLDVPPRIQEESSIPPVATNPTTTGKPSLIPRFG